MAEVVVIGAGVIGSACAYELAKRGARVTLVEVREPGQGATQASAGVLAPFIEAPADTALLRLCVAGLERYDTFVANIVRDAQMPVEYRRSGTIEVALDEDEVVLLERAADALRAMQFEHELLRGSALTKADPAISPAAVAALVVPQHGFVSAPALTEALVRVGAAQGVQFRTRTAVSRVCRAGQGDRLRVDTSAGPIEADYVVLAAGSWSGTIDIEAVPPAPVRPIRGQLLYLAWKATPLARVVWGQRCYMVPWADGTVLVGATVEEVGFAEELTVAGVQGLMAAAIELVPDTAVAGFKEARVGLRPASADTLPLIGPSPDLPGLVYATGHYRNGILLAPLTAEMVADCVLADRPHPLLSLASPARWQTRASQSSS